MARKSAKPSSATKAVRRILSIDIGGTGIKAALVGRDGQILGNHVRIKTPDHCAPKKMVTTLTELVKEFRNYDRVSIGFPGYVRNGKVFTAPHLGTGQWAGFQLAAAMRKKLGKPVRLNNDADVQGLGVIRGVGLELVCTLGTGLGTAWFRNGELMPHMDLAHMATHHKHDFDLYIGDKTLKKIGRKTWCKRVKKLIAVLEKVFFYDHLYLGGGNSRFVTFRLPPHVSVVSNDAGLEGGAFVWVSKAKNKQPEN
ncbi:MAG TPA: ROK family protein [Rhizomicrobium sp.]|nr:ROK family protein [Rhizomicrobium sp.]